MFLLKKGVHQITSRSFFYRYAKKKGFDSCNFCSL